MSQDFNDTDIKGIKRELTEPDEAKNPWPYAVWLFFGVMIGWGATYMGLQSGEGEMLGGDRRTIENPSAPVSEEEIKIDGSVVYKNVCMACHQQTGLGVPGAFPPLAGSEWVNGDPKVIAKMVLKGIQGPIKVKGNDYNGVMPAFESQLNDGEIAAVANYIRNEWGNKATEVLSTKDVSQLREELKSRTNSWNANELTSK